MRDPADPVLVSVYKITCNYTSFFTNSCLSVIYYWVCTTQDELQETEPGCKRMRPLVFPVGMKK